MASSLVISTRTKIVFVLSALIVILCLHLPAGGRGFSSGKPSTAPLGTETVSTDTTVRREETASSDFTVQGEETGSAEIPDESLVEVRAFRILNGRAANPVLDAVMPVVTDFRRSRVILILVWCALVIFGGSRGRWAAFMMIPLVAASDQISSHVVKPLIERMRPCEVLGGVHLWYGPEGWIVTPDIITKSYKGSFSFPSSHATNITASMLFLGLAYRRLLIPLLVVAVLVSYSRVYIGVHWLSDILAGMALGAALAYPAYIAFRRLARAHGKAGDSGKKAQPVSR